MRVRATAIKLRFASAGARARKRASACHNAIGKLTQPRMSADEKHCDGTAGAHESNSALKRALIVATRRHSKVRARVRFSTRHARFSARAPSHLSRTRSSASMMLPACDRCTSCCRRRFQRFAARVDRSSASSAAGKRPRGGDNGGSGGGGGRAERWPPNSALAASRWELITIFFMSRLSS